MTTLILPVAGRSSRFPNMRPKWLLTMPSGELMFEYSISKLDLQHVTKIVLVALAEHEDKFFKKSIIEKILLKYCENVEIISLSNATNSQSETVVEAIQRSKTSGPIFIKDCDNVFSLEIASTNAVAFIDLHNCEEITPGNKSYIQLDRMKNVTNIVEKKIISEFFCCGGYQFASAQEFVSNFNELAKSLPHTNEIYVSHVIYKMILDGSQFIAQKATDFCDIGTSREYFKIAKSSGVIFCDVDGVLCENGSKFSENGWDTAVISENVDYLVELQNKQGVEVIITTSRPFSERAALEKKLLTHGLNVKQFVMDLPHAQRILVNDFASTNTFPAAHSVNLPRNATNLKEYLKWLEA